MKLVGCVCLLGLLVAPAIQPVFTDELGLSLRLNIDRGSLNFDLLSRFGAIRAELNR
jgi:hypothetical protein